MYPKNKINKISVQLNKLKMFFPGDYQIAKCVYPFENEKENLNEIEVCYLCEEEGVANKIDILFEIFEELHKEGVVPVFLQQYSETKKVKVGENKQTKTTDKHAKD